jgi:hypothetical protein
MQDVIRQVEYLIWTRKVVTAANRRWRSLHEGRSRVLMCRVGLHRHLIRWMNETRRVERPPASPMEHIVRVFFDDPEAVKDAARDYYRILKRNRDEVDG